MILSTQIKGAHGSNNQFISNLANHTLPQFEWLLSDRLIFNIGSDLQGNISFFQEKEKEKYLD